MGWGRHCVKTCQHVVKKCEERLGWGRPGLETMPCGGQMQSPNTSELILYNAHRTAPQIKKDFIRMIMKIILHSRTRSKQAHCDVSVYESNCSLEMRLKQMYLHLHRSDKNVEIIAERRNAVKTFRTISEKNKRVKIIAVCKIAVKRCTDVSIWEIESKQVFSWL